MLSSLSQGLENLKNGKMVILVDDEDLENEGDLVLAADFVIPEAINFMITHARGLVCLCLESKRVDELQLPLMASNTASQTASSKQNVQQKAFTVTIGAREGVTTGISAHDRAHTIRVAVDPTKTSRDLVSPGHVFPLRAQEGGVLVRAGHTEGSVDLMKLADLKPAAVVCEIVKEDGTMARLQDLKAFAEKHHLPIVSIKDVISYRMKNEFLVEEVAVTQLPTQFSKSIFELHAFRSVLDGTEHIALVRGPIKNPVLVRVHSECLTGDALGSLRCDCGPQLHAAIQQIGESESGVLVYMKKHEGRGIGLGNKMITYALQDRGMDTVEANRHLGFPVDLRHYGLGAQILRYLGVTQLRLLTNNPKKVVGLEGYGLSIIEQIPIEVPSNYFNENYLKAKQKKMGHTLKLEKG